MNNPKRPSPVTAPATASPAAPPSAPATTEQWDLVAAGYAAEALPYFEVFAR